MKAFTSTRPRGLRLPVEIPCIVLSREESSRVARGEGALLISDAEKLARDIQERKRNTVTLVSHAGEQIEVFSPLDNPKK